MTDKIYIMQPSNIVAPSDPIPPAEYHFKTDPLSIYEAIFHLRGFSPYAMDLCWHIAMNRVQKVIDKY